MDKKEITCNLFNEETGAELPQVPIAILPVDGRIEIFCGGVTLTVSLPAAADLARGLVDAVRGEANAALAFLEQPAVATAERA
jgi:hypothetical protein